LEKLLLELLMVVCSHYTTFCLHFVTVLCNWCSFAECGFDLKEES
jgi:hypothetical protein